MGFSEPWWEHLKTKVATIGKYSRIKETDKGTTIIKNTDGNPVVVQLATSGRAFQSANTVETEISTQNNWYRLDGSWDSAHLNFISHDGSGGLTYDGDITAQMKYIVGGSYLSPSNNAEYEIAMFKDDELKDRTVMPFSPARQDEAFSLPMLAGFTDSTTPGMKHNLRVRCTNGVTNLTVRGLSFILNG